MADLTVNMIGDGEVLVAGVAAPGSGYTGAYFETIPLTLEAAPANGRKFVRWQETGETDPKISIILDGSATYTAVFEEIVIPKIVINELHYNPGDSQGDDFEFLELINIESEAVDLSGFSTDGVTFVFPPGSSIDAGEIIVLTILEGSYAGSGYQVFQWSDGKLSNGGEEVTLFDAYGNIVDVVDYDDEGDWPTEPDGNGPSLALLDPALDNSDVANWAVSPDDGGSPGAANPTGPPQPATLTIVKQVTGAVPISAWSFTGDLGAFTLPAAGGQQVFDSLALGEYTVTETAVAGYETSVSCTDGSSGTASVTVDLGSGADVTCTFSNSEIVPATLTVVKEVVGVVPATDWSFSGDLGAFMLPAAGGQQVFDSLALGEYTVTETAVAGYETSVSCTDGSSGTASVTVDLGSGADVTCTFSNSEIVPATLTIVKEVTGAVPSSAWSFTGDLGTFTLPAAGGQQVFGSLALGEYTVTETAVAGYETSVSCTDGSSGTASVTVDLGSGADVTCTFVNTEDTSAGHCRPPVPGNVLQNPGFEEGETSWRLYTNASASFNVLSKPAAVPYECEANAEVRIRKQGSNVQFTQKNFPLQPNTDYMLRFAARSSGGEDVALYLHKDKSPYSNYGLNTGPLDLSAEWQVFELTFTTSGFDSLTTDTRLRFWLAPYDRDGTVYEFDDVVLTADTGPPPDPAKLTIVKEVVGAAPGSDWSFSGDLGAFTLPSAGGQRVFNDLGADTYQVTETAASGYSASVSCTNGASGGASVSVTLAAGADVTCTFVNTETPPVPAKLTIVKEVVGTVPGSDWSFTGDLGAFTLPAAGGQQAFPGLDAGPYTVTEAAAAGYRTAVSCTSGETGAESVTVNLADGADVTCTFTNSEIVPAKLTIVKEVVGVVPASDWSFSGDLGAFTLPAAGGQQAFPGLDAGPYTVTETAVTGYRTAVSCTSGETGADSVTVNLADGADVTCTFVNTEDAAGSCSPPVPGNLLQNPGFEDGTANWKFYTDESALFSVVSKPAADPYQCDANALVDIIVPGRNVQLYQKGFLLKADTAYILRLAARSSGGEDISIYIHKDRSPYTNYGLNNRTEFDLTTEWQQFEVEFTTKGFSGTTTDTRLRIWLSPFDQSRPLFEFDDFVLIEK